MRKNNSTHTFKDLGQLRWACRRGMLELDVLLGNFLNERFTQLSPLDQASFTRLLSYPDPQLFDWLMGSDRPEDDELRKITEDIRSHARSRIQT